MDAKKANLNKDFKDRISPKSQFVKKRIPNVKKNNRNFKRERWCW